jgi:hypothetical protein
VICPESLHEFSDEEVAPVPRPPNPGLDQRIDICIEKYAKNIFFVIFYTILISYLSVWVFAMYSTPFAPSW